MKLRGMYLGEENESLFSCGTRSEIEEGFFEMMSEGKCCERRRRGRSCTKPTFFHILDATKHQQQRQQPAIISVIRFTGNLNIVLSQANCFYFNSPFIQLLSFSSWVSIAENAIRCQKIKCTYIRNQSLVIVAFSSTTGPLYVVLHRCSIFPTLRLTPP